MVNVIPLNGINEAPKKCIMWENKFLLLFCFVLFFWLEPLQGKISVFFWEYHCFYIQFSSWQLVTAILWDIKSVANASLFLLWRRMSAYSVWFVQPSNSYQWTEGSPSPTADWVVVQTAVWCVCWSQYNDALKSTLIKCLFTCQLTTT